VGHTKRQFMQRFKFFKELQVSEQKVLIITGVLCVTEGR